MAKTLTNKKLVCAAALTLLAVSGMAQSRQERMVRTPNYELAERFSAKRIGQMVFSTSVRPVWFRNGDKFLYAWKTSDGTQYYIADPKAGKTEPVFDMDKLAMQITEIMRDPFDAKHLPISNISIDPENDGILKFDIKSTKEKTDTTGKTTGEKLTYHFRYEIAGKKLTYDTADKKEKYPDWANVSPDGLTGVYMKNSNLFYMDTLNLRKAAEDPKDSTLVEHRITSDGYKDFCYGINNYSGNTETDTTKRVFPSELVWSPDSRHIAVMRWDMAPLKDFWVINSLTQPRPTLETYKYQMPGEPGPKGHLYVFSTSDWTSRQVKINAFKDQDLIMQPDVRTTDDQFDEFYSSRWLGDDNGFYLTRMSRDLKRMDICYVGVDSDSTRTVISERMNTYVESRQTRLLDGGRKMIHWSERNGWANLYLYNADGTLIRNLTEGAYHVDDVLAVNEKEGYVLFRACGKEKGENPYQMHVYRVSLQGGEPKMLDIPDMNIDAIASDDGKYFIANYSRVDYKPASALFDASGKKVCDLGEADFSLLFAAGYKFPERFKVKAADGITDLYGAIYKPFDFDSTKVYPICDYVYPGPQVEANNISWSRGFTRTDRLAQLGFIVITVGNRGGHPDRSKWYHNYGYGNLRDYGLEDQKYAIQQLGARYSWIDLNRVGIHGHSGGGFMSTAAMLKYPDFFKAAVSCAGNHDNSIYNRWWSEQHHGITEKVEAGDTTFVYSIETNPEIASNLKGHLMLVHGDIDNNVHPANTIRVVNALIRANKRFDMLILPGQRHGFGDMNEYFFWRMADYYCEWLMGSSKRDEVNIKEMNND
ncbi:MAG: S9 family peptidase [Bacteroidales bacterium]|jgi:dipeptidyl aminopeptidase/acylaminoacyl peptidase|nr:S9 family peptidase [Bacteroidales bacterium]